MNKGLVYVFTGEGKGKTSAALGVAVRAALTGKEVVIVQWYKEKKWPIAEHKLGEKFDNIKIYPMGSGFYKLPSDHATVEEHKKAAEAGLQLIANSLQQEPFLLVMDEILNAVSDGLLEAKQVQEILNKRGETHIILTGRTGSDPARSLLAGADLVTECKKIKHPYDEGKLAVKGLDY